MRIFLFSILVFFIIWLPFWVVIPCCFWYAYRYFGWELIVLAGMIDGYFGVFATPYYTIAATVLVLGFELIRPSLSLKVY